jgi:hypothetical protein
LSQLQTHIHTAALTSLTIQAVTSVLLATTTMRNLILALLAAVALNGVIASPTLPNSALAAREDAVQAVRLTWNSSSKLFSHELTSNSQGLP